MTNYKYKAISRNGAPVTGVIEAYDRFDAVNKIKETCPTVLELSETGKNVGEILGPRKVAEKSLGLMCQQFSIILNAGLPLVKAVELIAGQITDKTLRNILDDVAGDVAAGSSLASAFEKRGPRLPVTFVETLRAGEETGHLDEGFKRLAGYYDKVSKTKKKAMSALVYPIFVLIVAAVVIVVIMGFAMPTFSSTFESMGVELPFLTRAMIGTSNFFTNNYLIIAVVILGVIMGLRIYGKTERGMTQFAKLRLWLPVIGRISLMNNSAQFANSMSTLSASGISIVRSVVIAGRSMKNYVMGMEVQNTAKGLESGRRLADCMKESPYLPQLLTEMVAVGEETGALEGTLQIIADYYDNEAQNATDRALSLLEPALLVFLAVFVGMVLFAVYIPLFSMYGTIGG